MLPEKFSLLKMHFSSLFSSFFIRGKLHQFDLIRETFDTKLFLPAYNEKIFIPFSVEHNNKLVHFFQKEKKDKEIYEKCDK